jgi:hypothetical protein
MMYRRPHFLEELDAIREEMSRECDYDVDLFAEMVRDNMRPTHGRAQNRRGFRRYAPPVEPMSPTLPDQPTRNPNE